jgi:hypothetical protein
MDEAFSMSKRLPKCDVALDFLNCFGKPSPEQCPRGEEMYKKNYPDVAEAVERGSWPSGWEHFVAFGRQEGRIYSCCPPPCKFVETASCAEGDSVYLSKYPDVQKAIQEGVQVVASAWDHYIHFGKAEGRTYSCCTPQECQFDESARLLSSPVLFHESHDLCRMQLNQQALMPDMELIPSVERVINLQASFCTDISSTA